MTPDCSRIFLCSSRGLLSSIIPTNPFPTANNSKLGSAAGYIGYFDSAQAFKGKEDYSQRTDGYGHYTGTEDPSSKPTLPSKGNTTRNTSLTAQKKLTKKLFYPFAYFHYLF